MSPLEREQLREKIDRRARVRAASSGRSRASRCARAGTASPLPVVRAPRERQMPPLYAEALYQGRWPE